MILIGCLFLLYASVSLQFHIPVASHRRDSVLSVRDTGDEIHSNRVAIVDDQPTDVHLGQHDAASKARLGERCGPGKKKCESYLCCSSAGTLAPVLTFRFTVLIKTIRFLWHDGRPLHVSGLSTWLWHM